MEKYASTRRYVERKEQETHISGELNEAVEHVESVEVDSSRGHCVVPQAQRLPQLLYEPK